MRELAPQDLKVPGLVDQDEAIHVSEMMEKYGGSFVKSLADCIRKADQWNRFKIKIYWRAEWENYRKMK